MFDLTQEFAKACAKVEQLRQLVEKVRGFHLESGEQELLAHLDRSLQEELTRAKGLVPKAVAQLDQDIATAKQGLAEAEQRIAAAEQAMADAVQAAKAPPAIPEPAFDPREGAVLASELLQRFGTKRVRRDDHGDDVWKLDSGQWPT